MFKILLIIVQDETFLIEQLGGPLLPEYYRISIYYHHYNKPITNLYVWYSDNTLRDIIGTALNNHNHQDVIKFGEIRMDKDFAINMTKITVIN